MSDFRLGDVVDDFCVKCRRLTNHSIVSLLNNELAKVRCRTCYNDHDYRHEQAPPSKKDLKKQELFREVLAGVEPVAAEGEAPLAAKAAAVAEAGDPAPKKKARGKKA